MDADFPAAHSMDTTWFAVDKDGRVACFESGEAGAVPERAFADVPGGSASEPLMRLPPSSEVIYDLSGFHLPFEGQQRRAHVAADRGYAYTLLMFLPSLDPVLDEIDAGRAFPAPSTAGAVVLFRGISEQLSRRLHDTGACLSCFDFDDPADEELVEFTLARRGLFYYSHLTENWTSGPYGRELLPSPPLHIDQLPPALRNAIKAMRFDGLSFAETTHIQPVGHSACLSWQDDWLDLDGKQHPMPGREEDEDEPRS
jgi:hypothetical protein